jgi:hypothetical protein
MLTAMTDTERAEYDTVVRMLTAKVEELVLENSRLRSEKSDALSFLTEVFNDPNALPAHRLKAAGLVLPHQVPALKPVEQPMDLVAEPVEPLSSIVEKQRARMIQMHQESPEFQRLASRQVIELKPNGNADGDD